MSSKRPPSPSLIPNPFIKKRNLEWTLDEPPSAAQGPSPSSIPSKPTTAAIESGDAQVTDHLTHFSSHLAEYIHPNTTPLLSIPSHVSLYESNAASPLGAHFVIHQHDHPIAGTHYDLRLQINETSSASWAIMYGLPGDPNSVRLNRNATETRIHCLRNHLIETASTATGSLLIWDTGTYTILPRQSRHSPKADPASPPSSPPSPAPQSQQDLLHAAFQSRKIRIRLHGSRLPDPYVLNLRLTKSEDASGRARSSRTPRRRRRRGGTADEKTQPETSSDEEDEAHLVPASQTVQSEQDISAMEREIRELEDDQVRRTNAYPGATNTVGSLHQRRWYLSLDRSACGFVERNSKGRSVWGLPSVETSNNKHTQRTEKETSDNSTSQASTRLSFPFHVLGAEHETSVVTGRRGADILRDEGVEGFTQRKGWKPVLS